MAKKRYRMTPRRRAALKKAQAASARKRRKRAIGSAFRTAGAVSATVGSAFVAYHTQKYIARPDIAVRHASKGIGAGRRVAGGAIAKVRYRDIKKSSVRKKPSTDWSKFGYL